MKKFLCLFVLLLGLAISSQAYATDEEWLKDHPEAGGQCNFQKFLEDLAGHESGGECNIENDYGYMGKYQMGKAALQSIGWISDNGSWTGKSGAGFSSIDSKQKFLQSCPAQEQAMLEWADYMNHDIEASGLTQYIGQEIGGCTVTRSGLLAGRHLLGIGCKDYISDTECKRGKPWRPGIRAYLETGGKLNPYDANGTTAQKYICDFKGYSTPYDDGGTAATSCGGGTSYTGSPGSGKTPDTDPDGDGGYSPRFDTLTEGIKRNWIYGLMLMAEQFSVNMEAQLEAIGQLWDAKEQAEAQRDFQQRVAEAHRDYHPSEQMCTFGSFTTNLASTDRRADMTRTALSHEILQRELGAGDSKGVDVNADTLSRIKQFRDTYCNPKDNGNGLALLCPNETDPDMQNRDIDYTRTIDAPLTLDVNLTDDDMTKDEQTIFALIDYLFAHDPMPRLNRKLLDKDPVELRKYQYHYQNLRSIIAMRGIARNSISNIIALKSASPDQAERSGPYLKALMKELGLPDKEVEKLLGKNPSYYAQMEFLTKKIYQNPIFYAALYDKPVNVKRIRAAMSAIKLMNDRDIHDALLRREMLLSMMLELKLREKAATVYSDTESALFSDAE